MYQWLLIALAAFTLFGTALVFRPKPAPIDPFVGLWEFWANSQEQRQRYLSVTLDGDVFEVLRADSAYAELAAVARGRAVGRGSTRRVEVAFPDGERFILTMNDSNELVVAFDKPLQPEDISFSYFRSGVVGSAE